jgi:hypothetical protein
MDEETFDDFIDFARFFYHIGLRSGFRKWELVGRHSKADIQMKMKWGVSSVQGGEGLDVCFWRSVCLRKCFAFFHYLRELALASAFPMRRWEKFPPKLH